MEGKNVTVVKYKVKNGTNPSKLVLLPLINYRDYHSERFDFSEFSQSTNYNKVCVKLDNSQNRFLSIISNEGYKFNENITAFYNMYYANVG